MSGNVARPIFEFDEGRLEMIEIIYRSVDIAVTCSDAGSKRNGQRITHSAQHLLDVCQRAVTILASVPHPGSVAPGIRVHISSVASSRYVNGSREILLGRVKVSDSIIQHGSTDEQRGRGLFRLISQGMAHGKESSRKLAVPFGAA